MVDEKSSLNRDIEEKLDQFRLMLNKPAYFLTETVFSIITEIDYDTERILMDISSDKETKRDELNNTREEFIRILKTMERSLLDDLNQASFSKEVFDRLEKKVEDFTKRPFKDGELDDIEEEYIELAIDILAETYQLEKKIYDCQTFSYLPSLNKDEIGNLIYLSDDYMDPEELNVLKLSFWEDLSYEAIFDALQAETNRSLAVGVSRKSILSRNAIIIYGLPRIYRLGYHLNSNSKVVFFGATPTRVDLRLPEEDVELVQNIIARHFDSNVEILDRLDLDAVDVSQNPFKQDRVFRTYLSLHENRLRSLDLEFYAAHSPKMVYIRLSDNRLESFDHNSLARFENLGGLHMVDSFLPEIKFSLDFLASLSKLSSLHMTLPDLPDDFDFKNLSVLKLSLLSLHSAASLDLNKARPKLSKRAMSQLAAIPTLENLELTFFDFGVIDEDTFKGFGSLCSLGLINNRIDGIVAGAFVGLVRVTSLTINGKIACDLPDDLFKDQKALKFLSLKNTCLQDLNLSTGGFESMTHLHLDHNRICKLPNGIFGSLTNLNHLSLQCNRIRQLGRGLFDKLHMLKCLNLDDNPLETIEPGAFAGLWKLEWLSLNNCRLRTIKHNVFARMKNLLELWLNSNCIEAFEVETKKSTLIIKELLKPTIFVMVKQHLFVGLNKLKKLHLSGNKLTKLDLNCFANLRQLRTLNLANNSIDELNIVSSRLRMLGKLNLAHNQLSSIGRHAFSKSTRLVKLDLSHNRLKSLDDDFFEPFGSLESLSLNDNRLVMAVSDTIFPSSLRVLKLYNNERIEFENDAFRCMPTLKMIHMDLYASVDAPPSSTDDSEDDEDAWDVNSVEFFPLSKEHILSLHKPDSESLTTLLKRAQNQPFFATISVLAMQNGSLESLEGLELGARFGFLEKLVLSRNRLRTVEKSWFDVMPHLEDLDLSGNLIETLDDPSVFQDLVQLFSLNLSANKLRRIHRRLFNGMFALETLDLSNNDLFSIDCGPFRGLFNLEELRLSGNGIARLDVACLLRSCRKLESLDLANNLLDHASINEAAMSEENAFNLKELILAGNRFEKMDFVRGLYRLEKLDLSHNKIGSVESNGVNLLGRLVTLKHLDLSHNQISTIDEKILEYFDSINTFVYLSNIPVNH